MPNNIMNIVPLTKSAEAIIKLNIVNVLKMQFLAKFLSSVIVFLYCSLPLLSQSISPFSFGLNECKSPVERYRVLLRTHQEALDKNIQVDYTGISELHIEIPVDAIPIPLGQNTDFNGLNLYVTNTHKNLFLFTLEQRVQPIDITKDEFVSGRYLHRPEFSRGYSLLVIEDQSLWVNNRKGYDYGATRKDLILIDHGVAVNTPVASYETKVSNPKFYFCKTTGEEKVFKNLHFFRSKDSSFKTFLLKISNGNSVTIRNVDIYTPISNMFGDGAITIHNSANLLLDNVNIKGTYSQKRLYGYGVSFNNVWNSKVFRMEAAANWGIFGNYNVNKVYLKDCAVNRFDIHCYGRDVHFDNCQFSEMYNQYSSVYGTIYHKKCTFDQSIPCLIETSFNAYTPFDLVFEQCTFKLSSEKNSVVSIMGLSDEKNSRPELAKKCFPNVVMNRCNIEFSGRVKDWHIFKTNKKLSKPIGYCSDIRVHRLNIRGEKPRFSTFNLDVPIENKLNCRFTKWKSK